MIHRFPAPEVRRRVAEQVGAAEWVVFSVPSALHAGEPEEGERWLPPEEWLALLAGFKVEELRESGGHVLCVLRGALHHGDTPPAIGASSNTERDPPGERGEWEKGRMGEREGEGAGGGAQKAETAKQNELAVSGQLSAVSDRGPGDLNRQDAENAKSEGDGVAVGAAEAETAKQNEPEDASPQRHRGTERAQETETAEQSRSAVSDQP